MMTRERQGTTGKVSSETGFAGRIKKLETLTHRKEIDPLFFSVGPTVQFGLGCQGNAYLWASSISRLGSVQLPTGTKRSRRRQVCR